jgi:hypothetical protein
MRQLPFQRKHSMHIKMRFAKIFLITLVFICVLFLYLNNNVNKNLLGIIFDAFWINFLTVLYFLLINLTSNISLPEKYFQIRKFEKSGNLFRFIGVKNFKVLLTKNPFPIFTARIDLKGHSTESLHNLERKMRNIEAVHFFAFISTFIIMIPFGLFRDSRFFYFLLLFNSIENLYPILVQRYNRNRINKIVSIYRDKKF